MLADAHIRAWATCGLSPTNWQDDITSTCRRRVHVTGLLRVIQNVRTLHIMLLIFSLFRRQCLVYIMANQGLLQPPANSFLKAWLQMNYKFKDSTKSLYRKIWKSVACEQAFRRACSQARKSDEVKCYGHLAVCKTLQAWAVTWMIT